MSRGLGLFGPVRAVGTQQFNTTTSMGRLMLNVLLSFAQFEREVTGERIRDKIAAAKRKGMWMGGVPPLGYDVVNHQLIINEAEAAVVRRAFEEMLTIGSPTQIASNLTAAGITTKAWTTQEGQTRSGARIDKKYMHKLLETFVPWTLIKRGCRKEIITPLDAPQLEQARRARLMRDAAQDTPLLRALGLAHHWQRLLVEGRFSSISEIAQAEGLDLGRTSRIARLAQLGPYIVEAYMAGEENGLVLELLIRRAFPADWGAQRQKLLTSRE